MLIPFWRCDLSAFGIFCYGLKVHSGLEFIARDVRRFLGLTRFK